MSSLTRRQFLRLIAAGSSIPCLPACFKQTDVPRHFDIPGQIVNPSPIPGHLVRARYQARDFPAPSGPLYDAVVVGGGISGLAAAWKLRKTGVDKILLLELGEQVGGTSIAGFAKGTAFPWGAHYINIPPAEADCIHEILTDIGVIQGYDQGGRPRIKDEHLLRWPHERLYVDRAWVEDLDPFVNAAEDNVEVLRQFEDDMLRWTLYRDREGRRAFAMPLLYSSRDEAVRALDEITMEAYVRSRGWYSEELDWLLDYACRDDYGSGFDQVSAWAGIHYFSCRFYDQRVGDEYPADTLTWPEGNAYLVRGLLDHLGPEHHRTRHLVLYLACAEDGVHLGFTDLASGVFHALRSRTVIYAGKLHAAPHVIAGLPASQARAMSSLIYSPWLVAAIQLERRLENAPVPPAWDNIMLNSPSTGYVVADHQNPPGDPQAPGVLVYYLPFVQDVGRSRHELLERDHGFWVDRIMNDLSRAHPGLEDQVERIDLYRWGHAMVRPSPGVLWGGQSRWRRTPFGSIFFAGCDVTGLPLFEEACFAGIHAAEQVLEYLGVGFETSLKGLRNV